MPIDPAAFHDFEHAGWQRASEYYGDTFGTLTVQAIGPLLDAARVVEGQRVLDVATGPGYVAGAAAVRGATVTGVDFSTSMVVEARRRYPSVAFEEGDAEALAFDDAVFDAVVMNFGLLHLARPEAAISEAHRVLVPGGRYALTVWANPAEAVGFGVVLQAQTPEALAAIRRAVRDALGAYADGDAILIPMTIVLASGVKQPDPRG
jgi:ubiquinone/menaquinone biosynthesis C-methylase UbiE